jgi:hypothetical protein
MYCVFLCQSWATCDLKSVGDKLQPGSERFGGKTGRTATCLRHRRVWLSNSFLLSDRFNNSNLDEKTRLRYNIVDTCLSLFWFGKPFFKVQRRPKLFKLRWHAISCD